MIWDLSHLINLIALMDGERDHIKFLFIYLTKATAVLDYYIHPRSPHTQLCNLNNASFVTKFTL
jgi:hypothetical protein